MYRPCVPASPPSSANLTPSSSPVLGPVDSSPPSSPALVPYSLDPSSIAFSHPFAASTKAVKRLPNYEKKSVTPPCTPPGTFTRALGLGRVAPSRSLQEDDYVNNGSPDASPPLHRTSRYIDREERVWDDALRKPFDTGIGQIDLSNQQLKSIPASISDLSGFFNTPESSEQTLFSGRMLARISTEPAVDVARTRSFERTQSIKDYGKERHVLKLYLMGNMITSLPPELFTVKNLTVLSLRGNRLTFIPPDICRLANLHELNISNNQLKFLPWQMRDMRIDKLLANPNPFLPDPSLSSPIHDLLHPSFRSRRSMTRLHSLRKEALLGPTPKPVLSPITHFLARVPPLTELCLRILLAPSETSPAHTAIAEYYGLPLSDQWSIPPNVRHTLMHAVPGSLRPRKRFSVDTIIPGGDRDPPQARERESTGTCPNPTHRGRVYVRHASERFSWERRIAGVDVGGAVPLRWRGCLVTCLDFLDEEKEDEKEDEGRASCDGVPVVDIDGRGEESDVDVELAVQAVDLGNVSLDMDGFDD